MPTSDHLPIKYRPDIDGLRAVAIFLVVIFHAFPSWLPGGYLGVDIFFVISGFLITAITLRELRAGKYTLRGFYSRRIIRILPALVLVLLIAWLGARAILLPDDFERFGAHLLASATFTSNFKLLSESGYFDLSANFKPLLHLWSLAVEEQFYLVWPILLFALVRLTARRATGALVALILFSILANLWLMRFKPESAFYLPQARLWELLTGALLCFVSVEPARILNREKASWIAIVMIVLSLITTSRIIPIAILSVGGVFLLIASGPATRVGATLSRAPLVYVGRISFPLYLWHWPLLAMANTYYPSAVPIVIRVMLILLATILAVLTYEYFEKPAQKILKLLEKRFRFGPIVVCIIFLTLMGLLGWRTSRGDFQTTTQTSVKPFVNMYSQYVAQPWACFVDVQSGFSDFLPKCSEALNGNSILVWGDSYSSHLVYGLKEFLKGKGTLNVASFGASLCPPILNLDVPGRPNCEGINSKIFEQVVTKKPKAVLLLANWHMALGYLPSKDPFSGLVATIQRLHSVGIKNVFVAGQFPMWIKPLYKNVAQKMRMNSEIPERFPLTSIEPKGILAEKRLASRLDTVAPFIPILSEFCNDEGCQIFFESGQKRELQTFDVGHLTDAASVWIGQLVGENLLQKIGP